MTCRILCMRPLIVQLQSASLPALKRPVIGIKHFYYIQSNPKSQTVRRQLLRPIMSYIFIVIMLINQIAPFHEFRYHFFFIWVFNLWWLYRWTNPIIIRSCECIFSNLNKSFMAATWPNMSHYIHSRMHTAGIFIIIDDVVHNLNSRSS